MKCAKLPILVLATVCFNPDRHLILVNSCKAEEHLLIAPVLATAPLHPLQLAGEPSEKAITAREQLARLNIPYTEDAFVSRAAQGDNRAIALFLDSGLYPNARNQDGFTALMWSAGQGHLPIVET